MQEGLLLQIKEIKTQLRLAMNGVVSSSMRQRGLDYKINFGVSLHLLKRMAKGIGQNHELAQCLWMDDIRELKILATFIQPRESFTPDLANLWVLGVTMPEQAEYVSMNLFQYLPDAKKLSLSWLSSQTEMVRYTTWHLLARVAQQKVLFAKEEFHVILSNSMIDLESDQLNLFNGALLCLKRIGVRDKIFSNEILKAINEAGILDCEKKEQIIDDLKFEFDYYLQTSL